MPINSGFHRWQICLFLAVFAHQFNCWWFWLRLVWSQPHLLKYSRFTVQMVWSQTRERPDKPMVRHWISHIWRQTQITVLVAYHIYILFIYHFISLWIPHMDPYAFFLEIGNLWYMYVYIYTWMLVQIGYPNSWMVPTKDGYHYLWSPRSLILTLTKWNWTENFKEWEIHQNRQLNRETDDLWLFNIATENGPFSLMIYDDLPIWNMLMFQFATLVIANG